ncbi:hypothetical protein [Rhodococcus sp. IEGM 1408]|uniref:hypothetical protein n=1 Tax=Rhodococcus sp. IEGM 1408 TaxID=3082220 RepID=UPI0029539AA5|nr:hypothetical protein [Rhodococcus sp. IEGM 1408]MDV8001826.1 hypothetical protein [Rhodococcus sp. IEGM 1408]
MASVSLRSSLRTAVAVGAFGALAVFGTAATAGAQVEVDAPSFGSLGSLTGLIGDGNWDNLGGFFDGSVGETGSLTGSVGSVGGSLGDAGSQTDALDDLEAGSSQGSAGSVGQIAGNIDPDGLGEANSGSAGMSSDLTGMLTGVSDGSVGGLVQSGSTALGAFNPPAPPVVIIP